MLEFDERGAGPAKAVYVRLRGGNHRTVEQVTPVKQVTFDEHLTSVSEAETYARIVEIIKRNAPSGGWLILAQVGNLLREQLPEFDHNQFGAMSLSGLLRRIPELEFEDRGYVGPYKQVYLRVRQ